MARSIDTDPLQGHNFYLVEIPAAGIPAFPIKVGESALDKSMLSFQSIELPSMTLQTKKYQEGNFPFQHTIIMNQVQTGQVKIKQAVTSLNIDFWQWFTQAVNGQNTLGMAPRKHFVVVHTKSDKLIPRREVILWDCIPVEIKPSSELNAHESTICIEEIVMECNRFEVVPGIGTR